MNEEKFLKPDKGFGVGIMTEYAYKLKMNQILMSKDTFKIGDTPDNNHLIEFSVSRKLHISLLHSYISEAQYRRLNLMETETP